MPSAPQVDQTVVVSVMAASTAATSMAAREVRSAMPAALRGKVQRAMVVWASGACRSSISVMACATRGFSGSVPGMFGVMR